MKTLLDVADLKDDTSASDPQSARISKTLARLRNATVHLLNVEMMIGSGYKEPKPYEVRDGIAIVDISGPLMSDSYWYQDYDDILTAVRTAADDSEVSGILLRINSPGGETDRAFETASQIEDIGKKKPIWCVADVNAYSAGYLLACCAEKIYASPTTGGVGSIGVYCAHWDYSEYLKQVGIKVTLIGDPDGKTSGNPYEPLDDDAEKKLRAEIERLSGEFFAFVARRRKMTVEEVASLNAELFRGAPLAMGAKLADQSGTFESALADMVAAMRGASNPVAYAAAAIQDEVHHMDVENTAAAAEVKPAEKPAEVVKPAATVPVEQPETKVAEIPKPAAADLETVLALCAVAGMSATEAIELHKKGLTVSQLRTVLTEQRVAADEKSPTVGITGAPGKASSVTGIAARAESLMATSPELTKEQAWSRVLRANPALYEQYLSEHPAQSR